MVAGAGAESDDGWQDRVVVGEEGDEAREVALVSQTGGHSVTRAAPQMEVPQLQSVVVERRSNCVPDASHSRREEDPTSAALRALFTNPDPTPVSFAGERFLAMAAAHQDGVPQRLEEALKGPNAEAWLEGAQREMDSLRKHDVWELVPRPSGVNIVGCRAVLAEKKNAQGEVVRYKVRYVAQGFSQVEGQDYSADGTFSPVVKFTTLRILLSEAAVADWEVDQMDVETAFLYGDLDEEVYMRQPPGFEVKGKEGWVYRLRKGLYGLKQAARQWYLKLHGVLTDMGFVRSEADQGLYTIRWGGEVLHLAVYVDDFGLFANGTRIMLEVKSRLASAFSVKDLGEMRFCLGLEVTRDRKLKTLQLSQRPYIESLASQYHMQTAHPVLIPLDPSTILRKTSCPNTDQDRMEMANVPYARLLGGLLWVMLVTRPDLSFSVVRLAQYAANPGRAHWQALKRVLVYLISTKDWSLTYGEGGRSTLEVYSETRTTPRPISTAAARTALTSQCSTVAQSAGHQRSKSAS